MGRTNIGSLGKLEFKEKATSSDISFWIDDKSEKVIYHDEVTQNRKYKNLNPFKLIMIFETLGVVLAIVLGLSYARRCKKRGTTPYFP